MFHVKHLLNVGAGHDRTRPFPDVFVGDWRVWRLDFDLSTEPDIFLDARELATWPGVWAGSQWVGPDVMDGAALSHVLEHFTESEGETVLSGVFRVLRKGGKVVVAVPNLWLAAELLVGSHPNAIVYRTPVGWPIRPVDMLYGWQKVTDGHPLMCHKWGYTVDTLGAAVEAAGFEVVRCAEAVDRTEVHCVGVKP